MKDIVPIGVSSSPEIVYGFGVSMGYEILIFLVSFKERDLLFFINSNQQILSCKWISEEITSMV